MFVFEYYIIDLSNIQNQYLTQNSPIHLFKLYKVDVEYSIKVQVKFFLAKFFLFYYANKKQGLTDQKKNIKIAEERESRYKSYFNYVNKQQKYFDILTRFFAGS